MMDDSLKCTYQFTLTPLQITYKQGTVKQHERKSILIKLGNKTIKFTEINKSISIVTDVIYSKVLSKFCPLKGILKIYDVMENGKEIIACVGAFQTQDLLNSNITNSVIEKQIGINIIRIRVDIKVIQGMQNMDLKSSSFSDEQLNSASLEKSVNSLKKSKEMGETLPEKQEKQKSKKTLFAKKSTIKQEINLQKINCSSVNSQSVSNLSFSCQQVLDQFKKKEIEMLGEELIEERRKSRLQEQMIEKLTLKVQTLRRKSKSYQIFTKKCQRQYEEFIKSLEEDGKGQYIFQLNEKKLSLTLKYKKGYDFQKIFLKFLQFMSKQTQMKLMGKGETEDVDQILTKIDTLYMQKSEMQKINIQKQVQNTNLRENLDFLNGKMKEKQMLIINKNTQIVNLEKSLTESKNSMKNLQEVNQYLKQKDNNMEIIINQKDQEIEKLQQISEGMNIQIEQMLHQKVLLMKTVKNFEYIIEQLKEQIAIKQQTIETYMQKYGSPKKTRKRDIQNEINDCLRWINQQNRLIEDGNIDSSFSNIGIKEQKIGK